MVSKRMITAALLISILPIEMAWAGNRNHQVEKKILKHLASTEFRNFKTDQRCRRKNGYTVYLIDNFQQRVQIVPEIQTSHGEMIAKLLVSGRDDIDVKTLDTSLSKGLAQVLKTLMEGRCMDAVVSSTPGSNYSYQQISSLLPGRVEVNSDNILAHREALIHLLKDIAHNGFPSVEWVEQIDANPVKVRNDAKVVVFIDALKKFHIPILLPYGNADVAHEGRPKCVNLLSLASNARVYTALGPDGNRIPGFPYSPLSAGHEPATYDILECPDPEDPRRAHLDINNDGYYDYEFRRTGEIAYHDEQGDLSFAPPVLNETRFLCLLDQIRENRACTLKEEVVVTARQYNMLRKSCLDIYHRPPGKSFVWLNAPRYGRMFHFNAECRPRGQIRGTSVIPPHKVKELLPPKGPFTRDSRSRPGE